MSANPKRSLLQAAVWWARRGWAVFPLVPGGKSPLIAKEHGGRGYLDATQNEQQITALWTSCPTANIGGACGPSRASALDIDVKNDGLEHFNSLMLEIGAEQFATWRHATPSGGFHLIFSAGDDPIKNSTGEIAPGIDTRGYDGYIVLPPSIIAGVKYTIAVWEKNAPLLPFPAALRKMLVRPNGKTSEPFALPEHIPEGQRHTTLLRAACALRDKGSTAKEILAYLRVISADRCNPPVGDAELVELARDVEARYAPKHDVFKNEPEWPKPAALSSFLPSVNSMPLEMIPLPFRAAAADIADRMNVALEMVAVPLIVAAGSLIGRTLGMRPKQYDDWTEYPNLWGVIIGRPALKKTPALHAGLNPFRYVERRLHEAFLEAEAERAPKRKVIELDIARIERRIKSAKEITSGGDLPHDELLEKLQAQEAGRKNLVVPEPRRSVTDVTPEKLADLLAENPRGLLLINDELVAMLREFNKAGRENARAFYLAAWAGNCPHPIDRIGRGSAFVPGLCLAIIGTATPGAMREYIREAHGTGAGADGLLQRFQLPIWVDGLLPFRHIDRAPDADASERTRRIFKQIEMLDPTSFGAWSDGGGEPHFVRFSHGGQRLFDQWYERQDATVRACTDMPALESHLAKYPKLFAGLALTFHVIEGAATGQLTNRVGTEAAALAVNWCDYLEPHARRIYAEGSATPVESLADHIVRGDVIDGMTLRDVCQRRWSGLASTQAVHRAADTLVDAGWIRLHQEPARAGGGRPPSRQILVNPAIRDGRVPR